MKRCLLLLLLLISRVAPAQIDPAPAGQFVRQYAAHYRVSPELVAALIDVELRWNPRAHSSKGAMGLMQLMPATARRFGAAYYAGDHGIAREQLNYRNPEVVAYVLAVRRQFMIRKFAAMRPPRRRTP